MMDKTLPYYDIIMKADKNTACTHPEMKLPEGYTYHMYETGDEYAWAKLEVSVDEFETEEKALEYFNRVFMPGQPLLKERMCFIKDKEGTIVATATAWFKDDEKRHYALLHWVCVAPNQQGKKLGKSIVSFALNRFIKVEPNENEIYLHTQTWSYPAIVLYHKLGFYITKETIIKAATNYDCIPVLESVLDKKLVQSMLEKSC